MRILMTTDTVGGVWSFTASLCAALCGAHQVALVSFGRAPSPEQAQWVREIGNGDFEFHCSTAPLEWMEDNHRTMGGGELLRRVAEQFRPDLLHSNQFCWGALPRMGALDIPRVVTAHSDVLSWAAACRPQGLGASSWLDRYCEMVRQGLKGSDVVTAPTRWMLDALRGNFAVECEACVIPNGVTLAPSQEQPVRGLQAVCAGRLWDDAKNVRLLQDLDTPIPLIVAGESSRTDGVGGLAWAGRLSQPDLHQLFRASAIYLCPAIYEPFGLAPLEAALCGCALVLNDLPSLRETWGGAALYFSGRGELERTLRHLSEDAEQVQATAARCMARASELTAARMADAYAALFARTCVQAGAATYA